MFKIGDEIHETAQEARGGVNVVGMTTVLFVSLALLAALFTAAYLFWAR